MILETLESSGFFLIHRLCTACSQVIHSLKVIHSLSTACEYPVDNSWSAGSVANPPQYSKDPTVDLVLPFCYNMGMMEQKAPRKKQAARNHIIYELRVPAGNYIGVTAKTESTVLKSVRARAAKHFYRAKTESKAWTLCIALRELADKNEIEIVVHEIVRGKADAHRREVEIRRAVRPTLNTDVRGD